MNFFYSRKARKAFTLLELLIYAGILAISAGMIGRMVYNISRTNIRAQVEEELNSQLARFEENFRQKVGSAKKINSISGSFLSLEMADSSKNPTEFSLSSNIVYIKEGSGAQQPLNDYSKIRVTSLTFIPTGPISAAVSQTDKYSWNNQVGWINWAYPGGNVQVPIGAGELRGMTYILSDESWISLNCLNTANCGPSNYQVNSDANGNLSHWAWSGNHGWISFSCTTGGAAGENICNNSNYGVTVATSTGEFNGYAYSSNIGWISFNCKTGGANQTDICLTSDYKVKDLRMNTSAIKVDLTLQYNSTKPDLLISRSNSFVFNMISPTK